MKTEKIKKNSAIKVLIIEDEPVTARYIQTLLREFYKSRNVSIFMQKSLIGSQAFIEEQSIDLILLDLNINGEDGLEIMESPFIQSIQTIVISGNTERAIDVFRHLVLEFVPKPVLPKRLFEALEKYEAKESWKKKGKHLSIKKDDMIELVSYETICYLKGEGKTTKVFLKEGNPLTINKNINSVLMNLPDYFFRIHKSYVIPLNCINKIKLKPAFTVILKNGTELPVAKRVIKKLQEEVL